MIHKDAILHKTFMDLRTKIKSEYLDNQFLVGVTGEISSRKTFLSRLLVLENKNSLHGMKFHHIDYDELKHYVLGTSKERIYEQARADLATSFGSKVMNKDASINRNVLRSVVFSDRKKLEQFNELMRTPMLTKFYEEIKDLEGVILFDATTLVEDDLLHVVNNNVVLVGVERDAQYAMLTQKHGLSKKEADELFKMQLSYLGKEQLILRSFIKETYGSLLVIQNIYNSLQSSEQITKLSRKLISNFTLEKQRISNYLSKFN